jgi:hypothetical protein
MPRRDSNPQYQQASGHRPRPKPHGHWDRPVIDTDLLIWSQKPIRIADTYTECFPSYSQNWSQPVSSWHNRTKIKLNVTVTWHSVVHSNTALSPDTRMGSRPSSKSQVYTFQTHWRHLLQNKSLLNNSWHIPEALLNIQLSLRKECIN